MSTQAETLRGLLLLLVEVQNLAREGTESTAHETMSDIYGLVESAEASAIIARARELLEKRKTFFVIVSEQDLYKDRPVDPHDPPRGPILMETYLHSDTADRAHVEAIAPRFKHYGWVRVGEISVDIPEASPAAIPAAVAGVHA